jgi:hypothetical protein
MNHAPALPFLRSSWISLTATTVVVAIHHVYREGWQLALPFALLAVLPYLLARRFRATESRLSLWAYGFLGAVVVGGFGIVDGLLDHVTNAVVALYAAASGQDAERFERAFRVLPATPLVGDFPYEATGVLEFAGATVAAYYGYRFLRVAVARLDAADGLGTTSTDELAAR